MSFTTELKKRRQMMQVEKNELQQMLTEGAQRLQDINRAIDGIDMLLQMEGDETTNSAQITSTDLQSAPVRRTPLPLRELLMELMSDLQPHSVPELAEAAVRAGVNFGEKDPYKSVNFTLMGVAHGKTVERAGAGNWVRVQ